MFCPMCRGQNGRITAGTTDTLYLCKDCGYSRSHRSVNVFVELWIDFCEEQGFSSDNKLPANETELFALQEACLNKG